MKIINYGHACFKVINDDISIVFDPYEDGSVPGLNLPSDLEANYVFASHGHVDHNAVNKVKVVATNKNINIKEFSIPHDKVNGRQRGMSIARLLRCSDYSIAHMGDIGDPNSILNIDELKNVDVVLCPINGFYTISAKEARDLQEKMNWKVLIPMHYHNQKDNSGYPDGNQIVQFKELYDEDQILLLGDYQLDLNDYFMSYKTIIFTTRGNKNL